MPTVIRKNGRLIIRVQNGATATELLPAAYMSYCPADADYDDFFACGYRLFSFCVYVGDCPINEENGTLRSWDPGLWRAPDVFDFAPLDAGMARICGKDFSREVYVLLRINLNMPAWWREAHPEELIHLRDRAIMQSIASTRWRTDAARFLQALKAHIDASPYAHAVIGWQIAAMQTEEWIHPASYAASLVRDEPMHAAFRAWCADTYGTSAATGDAWGMTLADLADISLPTPAAIAERGQAGTAAPSCCLVRDFADCLGCVYADTIAYFTRTVKALFDRDILCGAFYGYIGQLTDLSGHTAMRRLLDEPSIDFFASPFAYNHARGPAVDWIYHAPMESVDRAGKLWFVEADVRTHLTRPLSDTRPDVCPPSLAYFRQAVFFGPDSREQTQNNLLRAFSKCLCSRNGFWWFDMWGGWYRDAAVMTLLGTLRALYAASVEEEDARSVSEVAVLLDERASASTPASVFYTSVTNQLVELGFLGAPYDLLLLDRVCKEDAERYKLFLLLSPDEDAPAYTRCRAILGEATGAVHITGKSRNANASFFSREALWRMVENAGVHLYAKGQIVYANSHHISVTATADEPVVLRMPAGSYLSDPLGGSLPAADNGDYTLLMSKNDCRLFNIRRSADADVAHILR